MSSPKIRNGRKPRLDVSPRTFFFAGKAAPAYWFAKLVIKFINNLAGTLDGDLDQPQTVEFQF